MAKRKSKSTEDCWDCEFSGYCNTCKCSDAWDTGRCVAIYKYEELKKKIKRLCKKHGIDYAKVIGK